VSSSFDQLLHRVENIPPYWIPLAILVPYFLIYLGGYLGLVPAEFVNLIRNALSLNPRG